MFELLEPPCQLCELAVPEHIVVSQLKDHLIMRVDAQRERGIDVWVIDKTNIYVWVIDQTSILDVWVIGQSSMFVSAAGFAERTRVVC